MAIEVQPYCSVMQTRQFRLLTWVLTAALVAACGAMAAHADPIPVTWDINATLQNGGNISGFLVIDYYALEGGGFLKVADNSNFNINVVSPTDPNGGFDFVPNTFTTISVTGDPLIKVLSQDPFTLTLNTGNLPITGGTTDISSGNFYDGPSGTTLNTIVDSGTITATPEPASLLLLASGLLLFGLAYRRRGHAL